jgi:hypothetical protein
MRLRLVRMKKSCPRVWECKRKATYYGKKDLNPRKTVGDFTSSCSYGRNVNVDGKIKQITKKYKGIEIIQKSSDNEKKNFCARRKAQEERVAEGGDIFESYSVESEDSQASLLDDLEQV